MCLCLCGYKAATQKMNSSPLEVKGISEVSISTYQHAGIDTCRLKGCLWPLRVGPGVSSSHPFCVLLSIYLYIYIYVRRRLRQ